MKLAALALALAASVVLAPTAAADDYSWYSRYACGNLAAGFDWALTISAVQKIAERDGDDPIQAIEAVSNGVPADCPEYL